MLHKLEHIGIVVKDIDRSIEFYTRVLGLKVKAREKFEGKEFAYLAYEGAENILLELISNWRDDLPARGNVDHIAFKVTDIDQEIERLKQLGVEMIHTAAKPASLLGGIKIAFFYGPDGERLELVQYD